MKSNTKIKHWYRQCTVLAMIAICFVSCKDSNDGSGALPFNPSKEVVITDFLPESGGIGQRLVIYGENFGNDPSLINLTIGGKKANVIGLNNGGLYCLVPPQAYSGKIEISISKDDKTATAIAEKVFKYEKKMIVSTLCGYRNERDDQGWVDGPFSKVSGFRENCFLKFDPKYPELLYAAFDGNEVRLINLKDSTVSTPITRSMGQWNRFRSIDFTPDGDHMIIANDFDGNGTNSLSVSILTRNQTTKLFENPQQLAAYKQCNGASVHPINGEMYFNSYEKGQFFRYDMENYYKGLTTTVKDYEELFKIQDNQWEFNIQIHPTGDYAYIVVVNQHYILRTDYNWVKKRFNQPYLVCGLSRNAGYVDGVGSVARLHTPFQGVFVKNPEYEGQTDEYDFYFTDKENQCIRILTPDGAVTTFAGRGSNGNTNPYGYVDGDLRLEARFDQPTGLAYSEKEKVFYICDVVNRRIRKIGLEQ